MAEPHVLTCRIKWHALSALCGAYLCVVLLASDVRAQPASTPVESDGRVAAAGAFLKEGERELAERALNLVLEADPTNWRARALLAVAYLGANELGAAQREVARLEILKPPSEVLDRIRQQVAERVKKARLRESLAEALNAGTWRKALALIEESDLDAGQRRLLQAQVAATRGDFTTAAQISRDLGLQQFAQQVDARADEFAKGRVRAITALNYLGSRSCGHWLGEMRRCSDQPAMKPEELAAWEDIRAGGGNVPAFYMKPVTDGILDLTSATMTEALRMNVALAELLKFSSMAPLHEEALFVRTICALYLGSQQEIGNAISRSVEATGSWQLKTFRADNLGSNKTMSRPLPREGVLVLDAAAGKVRYFRTPSTAWHQSILPVKMDLIFELPLGNISMVRSRPKVGGQYYLKHDSTFLEFGKRAAVDMLPDYIHALSRASTAGWTLRALGHLFAELGKWWPTAAGEFQPQVGGGGGWMTGLLTATAVIAAVDGDVNAVRAAATQLGEIERTELERRAAVWRAVDAVKVEGRSLVDEGLGMEALRRDLDALLAVVLNNQH